MLWRKTAFAIVALIAGSLSAAHAQKQKRAQAVDFTIQLFIEANGEFSPNIFKIEELGVFNFTYQGKDIEGGKFSGFLARVELRAPSEVFAQGRQAQLIFRDRKTKKVLRTWNITDIYVGSDGVTFRAEFFTGLDCTPMEVTLVSGATRITRNLPFQCGE